jgi:hypothetical protein
MTLKIERIPGKRRTRIHLSGKVRAEHRQLRLDASTGKIIWSEETFRIFQYGRTTAPTVELILQRVHPEEAAL